jgi:hypothetical protein
MQQHNLPTYGNQKPTVCCLCAQVAGGENGYDLVYPGCLLLGFLSYKGALIVKLIDDLTPKVRVCKRQARLLMLCTLATAAGTRCTAVVDSTFDGF